MGNPYLSAKARKTRSFLTRSLALWRRSTGVVQDILNLITVQGFVLEDVGPENYQTDLPVSPEVEEKVRSIFDLLRSVGPETVNGLPPVADVSSSAIQTVT